MSLLDRAISLVSPRWALERAMYRRALGAYDAARQDDPNSRWVPRLSSSEEAILPGRNTILARARDLGRNDPVVNGIVSAIAVNVVGDGFRLRSLVCGVDNKRDKKICDQLEDVFDAWARDHMRCDFARELTLVEMKRVCSFERQITGDAYIRMIKYPAMPGDIPLQLQLLENEQLDTSILNHNYNPVSGGIETDVETGCVVAYHFVSGELPYQERVRIPASEICHIYRKQRPSQIRGVSDFAQVMTLLRDLDGYVESTAVKARVEACFTAFITKNQSGNVFDIEAPAGGLQKGRQGMKLGPATVQELAPGEDIKFAAPVSPGGGFADFLSQIKMLVGAAVGASYELVSRDVSKVNYSSARVNLLEDRRHFRREQQLFINRFLAPVYREFVYAAVLAGKVDIPMDSFLADRARYEAHRWLPSGWDWVDPQKDGAANKENVKSGFKTRTEVAADKGKDLWDVLDELRTEAELVQEMGFDNVSGELVYVGKNGRTDESKEDMNENKKS